MKFPPLTLSMIGLVVVVISLAIQVQGLRRDVDNFRSVSMGAASTDAKR